MPYIDLRSDTVTKPTYSMRRAMFEAEVGDDVFGEDPTVAKLEKMAAELMGKEEALFVASGTMANLASLLSHCNRGDEVILGDQAHIFLYEQGGSAALGGIHPRTIPNLPDGTIPVESIMAAIRPDNLHFPRSRLIALENTHNRCFGAPLPLEYLKEVKETAEGFGLLVHMDGARIFNAAASLETDAENIARHADSVSFCLSKGLGAPAGSLVCGSSAFIKKARRNRKILGGGMRQAGILAAAGIVALNEMRDRLSEDHENASALAAGLHSIPGISIDPDRVKTNLVFFDITARGMDAAAFCHKLQQENVLMLPVSPKRVRAAIHYQVSRADISSAIKACTSVLK